MNKSVKMKKRMSITLRTALLSWLVTITTLLTFVMVIIPEQKRAFVENLNSKAHGVAVSLRDVAAGSVVNADFSTVVDHCMQMLQGDSALNYLVITRNDGFSLVLDSSGWRQEDALPEFWRPEKRLPVRGISVVPLFHRRVFHYAQPFDYSGIEWGWINVGLSLESFDRSVASVYWRTGIMAILFVLLSFLVSIVYAKRLVKPIMNLQGIVRRIAGGDLSVLAAIEGGEELASLAVSVNTMTESLSKRDRSLQSVRFSAQRFLSTTDWNEVIDEVLGMIGEATKANRVHVIQNQLGEDGSLRGSQRYLWLSGMTDSQTDKTYMLEWPWYGSGVDHLADSMKQGEMLSPNIRELDIATQSLLESLCIKSLILAPIRVEGAWWGVLGLDCSDERRWTDAEQDSLRAIADMLGAAIGKKMTQDAMLSAKESADAANQAKSQFLANMSHEIRTPMNGVLGMADLLLHTQLSDKQLGYARAIRSSGEALLSIIDDVLDLSKIEAGKLELEEIGFDSRQIVEDVVELLGSRAQQKAIRLIASVAPDVPPVVVGDPGRLRQVLLNMVSNAVKFTEDGEVAVRLFQVAEEKKSVCLRFEVQDTGLGIPDDAQASIFEPFVQADGSMTRKFGGTGLGLAITRQLVEMMGGEVGVVSAVGKGSTFWFTLVAQKPTQHDQTAESKDGEKEGRRILVVGSARMRLKLQQMLNIRGLMSGAAENAWQAVIVLRSGAAADTPYDTLILDTSVAGENGGELLCMLKNEFAGRGLKIVLVATQDTRMDESKMRQLGIDACLVEPIRPNQLLDCLKKLREPGCQDWGSQQTAKIPAKTEFHARVLVAEDNVTNQQVVSSMLDILGCQVDVVSNGHEVLTALSHRRYDLILMDCQMPEMDGYEATRAIRMEEAVSDRTMRMVIIALTANAMEGDRERCLAAGMDDYLGKPFGVEQLQSVMDHWLQKEPAAQMPLQIHDMAAGDPESDTAVNPLCKCTILVAEDNAVNQQVVTNMLELLGCSVEVAEDGQEALVALSRRRFDLVLMDGQMPRMDGYEATRLLRERENSETETFRTPVVAMTAHASLQDRQRCFNVGMDDYLSKPFKIEQLRCILEHWLPGSADLPENACEAVPGLHNPWAPGNVPQFQGLVLVVEDDLVIQELVVEMIEGFGCRADAVASGRQALDALTQRHYDMVLMDYEMPDMDGAEATRVIREREASDPTQAHVPIIATTGHGSGAFREKCLTAGMDDHLGKPFVLEKLLAILQRWFLKTAPDRCSAAIRAAADVTAIVGAPEVASVFISKGSAAAAKKAEWSLNHEALNNLRALQRPGSPDLLERLVASYLKDTPPMLERFRDAFVRDDHELACSIAHSLKSSSAYLGAAHFSEMFKKIESLARSNALCSAREMIPEVSDEFERVRQALLHEI